VKVISAPSWWTLRHTLALALGMAFLIAIALGWVALLRSQVRVQTDLIHKNQKDLAEVAHRAGMAEVATSVLHNVGNALTNVNVSSALMEEQIARSKVRNLVKAADLLKNHAADLPQYLATDLKGRRLPGYFGDLAKHLASEHEGLLVELRALRKNVEHIRQIVAMQQDYAKVSGATELLSMEELVDDALRMNESALKRYNIEVVRHYGERLPKVTTQRNQVLQILVNLIQNAKHACATSPAPDKQIEVTIELRDGYISVSVSDNGVGIAAENLNRVFQHGFTTRQDGHGFGLHGGALAAAELGGSLKALSAGVGHGARFTLELPVRPEN
jgi:signal transduction histidine kinase